MKMSFFLDIFQEFCLKVSEDFFYNGSSMFLQNTFFYPCIFVVIVNALCAVLLKVHWRSLKISLYILIDIKIISWKFRIFTPKNSRVIHL